MGWDTRRLVSEANKFALEGLQSPEVPALQKKTVGKMGLKGVPGLVLKPNESTDGGRGGQGGRNASNGGGQSSRGGRGGGGRGFSTRGGRS